MEVKARKSSDFGYPSEFVDNKKQNHIKNCAQYFLLSNNIDNADLRFDVISIENRNGIEWIENAF